MLNGLRSRLTYANVVATGALFVALGGGAYALTGVPDRGGVFHGCVSNKTSVLRVVKSASSCQKAKGRGKRRTPGEFAVSWSQQGPRGFQGLQGVQGAQGSAGLKGDKGDQGPAGPTQAFAAAALNGSIPSSTPDSGDFTNTTTVTTPTSGRLFAFARGVYAVACTAGTGVQLGLYVDGTPVHASGRAIVAGTATDISVWGLSDTVSAGTHTVSLRSDCTGGTATSISASRDAAVGAIFVGS